MKAKRSSEEQIIAVLRDAEAGVKTKELCRKLKRLLADAELDMVWRTAANVQLSLIRPGKPNENDYIKSFNGREECLNEHWFITMKHARQIIENWRIEYNTSREHCSLGKLTPQEHAQKFLERAVKSIFPTADSRSGRNHKGCQVGLTRLI